MTNPIITGVMQLDIPPRPKRGIKPHNIDHHVAEAIKAKKEGSVTSAEQAAYRIASKVYDRDHREYEAFRAKLKRRFRPIFAQ